MILVKKPLFLLCIIDVPMVCCFLCLNVILVGKNMFFLQKRFTFDHFFDQNGIRKTSGVPLTTSGVTMGRLDDVSVAQRAAKGFPRVSFFIRGGSPRIPGDGGSS